MAVDSIHSYVHREKPVEPRLQSPEIIDQLRHGNILEVLRSQINREDFEKFIAYRGRLFDSTIIQNHQVYADQGSVPAPSIETHFPPHHIDMAMTSGDRDFLNQEQKRFQYVEPLVNNEKVELRAKAMIGKAEVGDPEAPPGPGQDVAAIAEGALGEWEEFFGELQWKMIDNQMFQQLQGKAEELNRETERIVSLVMSGQVDPEYVLIAACKSNMAQNGILFSWKGKRIMHLNEVMNKSSKDLYQMDPNDQGYFRELQMSQSEARGMSTQMQMELMDIQKFAQNVTTSIEFANNAVRTFAQMRQTPTAAIAARG